MTVGNAGLAGEARRVRRCRRLVAVDKQHAAGSDRVARHLRGRDRQSRMAVPQNGPFSGCRVDDHDGELAGGAADIPRGRHVHALLRQARTSDLGQVIVSEAADVAGAPSQAGAHRGGGGHLPAGQPCERFQPLL